MSRPLRIEYPGAWYHVMNRGLGRRWIFKTGDHRQYFLSLLGDTADRFNADWHAYCLMDNHYHLMLHTPEGNLQRIMRHINGLYTQYFNRTQHRDGPLFRGRYKAILVDADSYWLSLSRYIHRNPLEAGIVQELAEYQWTSYLAYTSKIEHPDWLTTHCILDRIGKRNVRQRYADFVNKSGDDDVQQFYNSARHGTILGEKSFRERALAGKTASVDIPELKTERPVPDMKTMLDTVCHHFQTDEMEIWHKTRGRGSHSPARGVMMYICQQAGQMTLAEIASTFDLSSYASAGSSIRRIRQRVEEEPDLKEAINYILLDLTP